MNDVKTYFQKRNIDLFFPIAFVLGIVPLIVRMSPTNADENSLNLFGASAQFELFSQKKALILLFFSIILILLAIIYFKKIFKKLDAITNSIVILGVIFLLFTFLSSIFSQYRQVSFSGVYDRAEGFITLACYFILFIYSIYTFKSTENYKYVIIPILILVFINAFLGFFQYFGYDLIKTRLGTLFVMPTQYQTANSKLNLLFDKGKLYGTLFHYDYVGSFVAIVLPILLSLTIFENKSLMHKITLGAGTLLSIWLLFGSTSRSGLLGVLVTAIFSIVIFAKLIRQKLKPISIILGSLLVIIIGFNFATGGTIFERIPSLVNDSLSIFKNTSDFDYTDYTPIKDLKYDGTTTEVILQNETLKISYENNDFIFRNSKNDIISYVKKSNQYTTTDESFKNISFSTLRFNLKSNGADTILLNMDNKTVFMFSLKSDNTIHLVNINTHKDINLEFPETFGFKGKEKLGSSRGYIWARSIPLLKENLILGGGPDTFAFRFPQNDFIGKLYAYDSATIVVDKPHNLYLQIGLNEGVIALIAFLGIMIIYIVNSLKLYALKTKYTKSEILGCGTCLGVIGYLFAGFFNDSVVSVAPVFWIILGVGVALNFINRNELKTQSKDINSNKKLSVNK